MMHQRSRSDAGELNSQPSHSRAASFSSDRASVAGSVTFHMPPPSHVRPAPAYIAASVASQTVTEDQNAQLEDHHEDSGHLLLNALFSEKALSLLNAFLDHLLFAFLSTASSPSLTSIRPAITEVLKPRLARDAMATADEELEGLLAGEDEDEFPAQDGLEPQKWDVEKMWKRTRLRIMVYTRLGELEDEDEERYVQHERGLSMDDKDSEEAGLVSWASAIFLTSVIEHIAEQTLLASGQAAFARTSAKLKKLARHALPGEEPPLERLVIEDFDVEKLAVNAALGRLWRTWRKRVRSPVGPLSPRGPRSMSSMASLHRRRTSYDTVNESTLDDNVREVPEHEPTETEIAANIPLPMRDNDVSEIEVPGLAHTFEEDGSSETETPTTRRQRPSSVVILGPADAFRRRQTKGRPLSMPPPQPQPFAMPHMPGGFEEAEEQGAEQLASLPDDEAKDMPFVTPMERMSDDDSYIHDERQEGMSRADEREAERDHDSDADMVAFAASTGMGFGMSPMNPVKSDGPDQHSDADNTPRQSRHEEHNRLIQSKRISMEKAGPPGIARTYPTKSPAGTPQETPKAEASTFFDDSNADNDMSGPNAIGVARTSNVPIPPTPSPPPGEPGYEFNRAHRKHPSHGGYTEVLPRQTAPTSMPARNNPTSPEETSSPIENPVSRKEVPVMQSSGSRDTSPRRTRAGLLLPALQEGQSSQPTKREAYAISETSAYRNSPTPHSPRAGSSLRSHESPIPVAERAVKPKAYDSLTLRSLSGTPDTAAFEKPILQRVSSTSTTRSAGTSILHTGRDSSASVDSRQRNLSIRMSEEDRQREFDTIVKGDETVKFTLTPETVRDNMAVCVILT
jgi:hypothetical protein